MKKKLARNLLQLMKQFCADTGRSKREVQIAAINSGSFLIGVEKGDNFTIERHDKLVEYLSDHWASETDWPSGIPRPVQSHEHTAA